MSKPGLNTHVFGQSVYNWIPLPAETGQTVEIPIPPVKGMKDVLVFISATFENIGAGDHFYAVYTKAIEGGPIPFHNLFLVGSASGNGTGCNSENLWLNMPEEGLPRVVYVQKMSGAPLAASANFRSGVTVLTMR
ncbi:MAG: hypothetical protein ACRCWF_02405 [Beijerinckiaceae bacterium]